MLIHTLLLKHYIRYQKYNKINKEKNGKEIVKCKQNYNIFINYLNMKGYYLK